MHVAVGNGDKLDITHTSDTSLALSSSSMLPIKDVLIVSIYQSTYN